MRLSEVLLRIGCSLAAWMVIAAYFIWMAIVHRVECGADGDEIFRLLMGVAPVAIGASFLLRLTHSFPDIFRMLRWISAPVLLLLLLTVPVIWQVFTSVNLQSAAICGSVPTADWHSFWAPLQFIASGICTWNVVALWRSSPRDRDD